MIFIVDSGATKAVWTERERNERIRYPDPWS